MKIRKFRLPEGMYNSIHAKNKSAWVRDAIQQKLLRNKNLTEEYVDEIIRLKNELRAIGININQLARRANQGKNVSLKIDNKDTLFMIIRKIDKSTRAILHKLKE